MVNKKLILAVVIQVALPLLGIFFSSVLLYIMPDEHLILDVFIWMFIGLILYSLKRTISNRETKT